MHKLPSAIVVSLLACASLAAGSTQTTPAERLIVAAKRSIEHHPGDSRPHADLALALARRARETHDPRFYEQARSAVQRSLQLAPDNHAARRAEVWILLGQHEFERALERATALLHEAPDDPMIYGFLVDANVELGRYDAAEEAAQWLLDLRPGGVPGLTRAAYLRELFGDLEGAQQLMSEAYGRVPTAEVEERAWILTQIGKLQLHRGQVDDAATTLEAALELFPGYHYALAALADVRTAQGDAEAALELYRRRYEAAPHPECLYDLALALERTGSVAAARAAFTRFEREALAESERWDNANRELVRYYLEQVGDAERALEIARKEVARRRDVRTLVAYARALHGTGDTVEARAQIEAALAVGTADAESRYVAGLIAADAGEPEAALEYLGQALDSPFPELRAATREALGRVASMLDGE